MTAAAEAAPQRIEDRLSPDQMRATGLDQLTAAQLRLLNELLIEPEPEPPASPQTANTPQAPVAPATPNFVGYTDAAFADTVVGTVTGWEPGSEFELRNGQRWKVLKGTVQLVQARIKPSVRLIPGAAGRWFLQIDESLPSARVYRIR